MLGAAWAVLRTDDRPGSVRGYEVYAVFDSAQGIYVTTQVRIAGVSVGSVRALDLDPGGARLRLEIQGEVVLPQDSLGELKGEGVLGDRYINILPGSSDLAIPPGGQLATRKSGSDLDALQAKVDLIADDVKAITGALRTSLEDDRPQESLARTLENVERITAALEAMTVANRGDVDAIADNIRALTAALNGLVAQTSSSMDAEMVALRQATERLDRSLARVESISTKIDEGEGTLGRLVNDDEAMDQIEGTLADVGEVVDSVTGLHTQIYYRGSFFLGTDPAEPGFSDNPVSGDSRNIIGLELKPREDYWYLFELVDHPVGEVTYTEHYLPETGARWTEYERRPKFLYSFMFAKRYRDLVLRLGVKESAGGFGVDYLLLRERLALSADLYDFDFGSWPVLDGTPNLTLNARLRPHPHLYVEGGLYNMIFGIRHDHLTGFVGGGFTFTDDDFKWVLSTIPFPG